MQGSGRHSEMRQRCADELGQAKPLLKAQIDVDEGEVRVWHLGDDESGKGQEGERKSGHNHQDTIQ